MAEGKGYNVVLFDYDGETVDQRIVVDPLVYMERDMDAIIAGGRLYVIKDRSQRYTRALVYDHDTETGNGAREALPIDTKPAGEGANHGAPTA